MSDDPSSMRDRRPAEWSEALRYGRVNALDVIQRMMQSQLGRLSGEQTVEEAAAAAVLTRWIDFVGRLIEQDDADGAIRARLEEDLAPGHHVWTPPLGDDTPPPKVL